MSKMFDGMQQHPEWKAKCGGSACPIICWLIQRYIYERYTIQLTQYLQYKIAGNI